MNVGATALRKRRPSPNGIARWLARRWLALVIVLLGVYNLLPFLAPAAMRLGWTGAGEVVYRVYSTQCHQMAQRSFFLFGPKAMYNIDELPVDLSGDAAADTLALRRFTGNETLGWKVAWSDRMVAIYGSLWLASLAYWLFSRRRPLKPLPLWVFALLVVPMALDGFTHLVSDVNGLTAGFRYHNAWLADLTGNTLPARFYVGDALGSFNSWLRLLSGLLFGVGVAWLVLPWIDRLSRAPRPGVTFTDT